MIITYRSTRADIWRAYGHVWWQSRPMKIIQLSIFVIVFTVAHSWLEGAGVRGTQQFMTAIGAALVVFAMFVAYPQLRFKPEERALRIGPAGISTTIGSQSGEIGWSKVARITPTPDAIYIVGTGGHGFCIPNHAFASSSQRADFIALAQRLWARRGPDEAKK